VSSAFIGSVNLAGQVADKLLSFGQIILIAAVLGSTAGGDLFFLASVVPLTIGFVVGEPVGRAYLTLLVREREHTIARQLAAAGFVLTAALLIATTLLYSSVAIVLVSVFTPAGSGDIWPWLAFAALAPAMGIAGLLSGLLIWQHRYGWAAARSPLASLAGLVGLAFAVELSNKIVWIALALSGGYIFAALVLYFVVARSLGRSWVLATSGKGLAAAAEVRTMLIGPSVGAAIGGQVLVTIERVLAATIGAGSVASISYARGMATAPTVLAQAVGASAYPRLVRAEAVSDLVHIRESLVRGLRLSLYLGIATSAFLVLFGQQAVSAVLARGRFDPSAVDETGRALVAFAFSTFTGSLIVYLVSVIYGLGRFRAILWLELAIFVTYLMVAPALRLWIGFVGLAAAFAVSQAAGVVVACVTCMRATGITFASLMRRVAGPIVPLAGVLVAVLLAYRGVADHVGVPIEFKGVVIVGGGGLCLLVAGSAVLLLSGLPEAAQIREAVRRRLG
jgi:peptidoglycan biosynthesis protein MviN/MurJ (putative lipid II flippase)